MEEIIQEWGLWGLFASAFISSTLAPGGSEALFVALVIQGHHSGPALLLAATAGNALGGFSTWLIGRLIATRYPLERLTRPSHPKAVTRLQRWGNPALLFSWLPLVGDPLCLAAGWLRTPAVSALLFITLGKGARYALLLWATGNIHYA